MVARSLFGLILAGLFPVLVTQLKLVRKLETRFQGTVNYYRARPDPVTHLTVIQMLPDDQYYHARPSKYPAQTYNVIPWNNPWMRRLAGGGPIKNIGDSDYDTFNYYNATNVTNPELVPLTIYNYNFTSSVYNDYKDWSITVDVGVP
jgi:hypothetical protein